MNRPSEPHASTSDKPQREGGGPPLPPRMTILRIILYHLLIIHVYYTLLSKFEWNLGQNG